MKSFHYYIDTDTGEVEREVPMTTEDRQVLAPLMEQQRLRFVERFGREPGPDDPIFFDEDLDEDKLNGEMAEVMRSIGIRPALIYATQKTGLIVTEQNRNLIPDIDLEEWEAAIEEYYDLHPEADPGID
jgi:hypothetical protein